MSRKDIWTEEDEKQLLEMQTRKQETQEKQGNALLSTIREHVPLKSGSVSDICLWELKKALISNGGAFRDALEPFDHMGRSQASPATQDSSPAEGKTP